MSPSDQRDEPSVPQPFFKRPQEPDEGVETTGLFQPRPQDVRPWELFAQQESDAVEAAAFEEAEPSADVEDESQLHDEASSDDLEASGEPLDQLLGSTEELADLLDGTLDDADPEEEPQEELEQDPEQEPEQAPEQEPLIAGCPNCEATEAAAEATLDATIEALQLPYFEGAQALQRAAQDVSKDFIQNLLQLSVELASAVLHRAATIDPNVVLSTLDSALEIAGPVTELTIRCHPDDAELLRLEAPVHAEAITGRLVDVQVSPGAGVDRGACIVDFGDGLIDARWQVQLNRLADALSPTLIHHVSESAQAIVAETVTVTEPQFTTAPETQPPQEPLPDDDEYDGYMDAEAGIDEPLDAEIGDADQASDEPDSSVEDALEESGDGPVEPEIDVEEEDME